MRYVWVLLLCGTATAENILVVGDSYSRYLADAQMGGPVLQEIRDAGHDVRIEFRNKGCECGTNGGAMLTILDNLDCLDFEWADRVVLMAGYWDANPKRRMDFGAADKAQRTERAEAIRQSWESRKRDGAEFHWLDTWDWAKRGESEGFLFDDRHVTEHGYRLMLKSIGLL